MPITSHLFLLVFLVLRTPRQKMFFLLAASCAFYAAAGLKFLPVLLGLSLTTWLAGRWNRGGAAILLNLAALLLFKYWNFGIENVSAVLSALHIEYTPALLSLGMPLGLSFFVFKHIGYLIDLRQRRYEPAADLWSFATYSTYFPQISAGPISNYRDTASQFESLPGRLEADQLVTALVYISYGLAKKILIADTIGAVTASRLNQVSGSAG